MDFTSFKWIRCFSQVYYIQHFMVMFWKFRFKYFSVNIKIITLNDLAWYMQWFKYKFRSIIVSHELKCCKSSSQMKNNKRNIVWQLATNLIPSKWFEWLFGRFLSHQRRFKCMVFYFWTFCNSYVKNGF